MAWKLFIDDERFPIDDGWIVARSSTDAIAEIARRGWPSYISFDHDLGGDDTTKPVVDWMIGEVLDGNYRGRVPDYYVHSQNPIGRDKILALMRDLKSALDIVREAE